MFKKIFFAALAALFLPLTIAAEVVYSDTNTRFTLIDEGTIRLEYAPDGKFVDNKSFMAVVRNYDNVPHTKKETSKKVTIKTSKITLSYTKGSAPLSSANLKITSAKSLDTQFTWTPGMKQMGNLKGTARTLDGFDGDIHMHSKERLTLEDGLLATDGWTLIDDSKNFLFNGDKDWDWVTTRNSGDGSQDWYFMAYGHDYKGALTSYTRFAGKVPMPPRYAFGYWWSRYWSYSDQDFRNLIQNFKSLDIPLDVLVIDMDWHPISESAGGGWTGWDWNENLFPNYKEFLSYLDKEGIKKTLNLHPADGVRPYEKRYPEFAKRLGINHGKAVEWLGSDKKMMNAIFDTYLHPYMEDGVDFWWIDWQQWLTDKKVEGLSNTFWCNYIWFSDMERQGKKRPMLYHRWGGLGNHRYQIGFSGDAVITWKSLEYLPYFNSTASNVLYGYWSHDIGGHFSHVHNTPLDPQLYTRAMQMGKYLPILRTHSTKDPALNKEPWAFEKATQQRIINAINGRYELVPYIYSMARQTYENGISLCRPMYYDYPECNEAYEFKSQYMFGDNILIAPITSPISEDGYSHVKLWLPEGEWLEYETGTMISGNCVIERAFNMDEYPVYIKAGSIIPYFGKLKNLSGTVQAVTVRIFPGGEDGHFSMYEDNGEDAAYADNFATTPLSYSRNGNKLSITIGARSGNYPDMPAKREFTIALPCQAAPNNVSINGNPAKFSYDGANLEATIALGAIECSKGATVEVTFPEALPCLTDGMKAKMSRIQSAMAMHKQVDCGIVYTDDMGYLESAPIRMTYFPEKQAEIAHKFCKLYNNISSVLKKQMGEGENMTKFLKALGENSPCTK